MGSTDFEKIKVENWLEFLLSILHSVWEFENVIDGYQKGVQASKKRSQFLSETLHPMLNSLDRQLGTDDWALGFYSVVDIVLYSAMSVISKYWGEGVLGSYKG